MVSLVGRVRTPASGPLVVVVLTALVAAIVLAGATTARSNDTAAPRPVVGACGTPAPGVIGTTQRTLSFQGTERRYLLHVPASYDGSRAMAVIVLFHGLGRGPEEMLNMTRMDQLADAENAVVVAPQALGKVPAWQFREVDGRQGADVAFVDALLDDVRSTTCTDESRTYAVGFSNGGALTMALACRADHRFAAYASVAGPYRTDECDDAPASPLITFHGLKDTVVPVRGADDTKIGPLPSAVATTSRWATQNGCLPGRRTDLGDGVVRLTYDPCAGNADVVAYFLGDGKHRWPGGDEPSATTPSPRVAPRPGDVDASQLIWDFVRTHRSGASS